MTSPSFPLQSLLLQLESHGYQLDPARQMRLQEALLKLGPQYRNQPEALGRILTPLIAQDEQEQQEIQRLIGAYLVQLREEPRFAERQDPTEEISKQLRQKRVLAYVVAFSLFIAGILVWQGRQTFSDEWTETQTSFDQGLIQGDENAKAAKNDQRTSNDPSLQKYPRLTSLEYRYTTMQFGTKSMVQFFLLPSSRKLNTEVKWEIYQDGKKIKELKGEEVSFFTDQYGSFSLEVSMYYPGGPVSASISKEQPFLYLPARRSAQQLAAEKQQILEKSQNRTKITLFFLLVCLIVMIEALMKYWEKQAYRLYFQREFVLDEEGEYQLPHADSQINLEAEPAFHELAEVMAQQQYGNHQRLDINKTLYTTIRNGGLPSLQYRTQKLDTEYLVLIDESTPNQNAARLFGQLVKMLAEQEVAIRSFRFRNDPRECVDEAGQVWELDQLARHFGNHKLILFGKGSYLARPNSDTLQDWVLGAFSRWETRILISPERIKNWHLREKALSLCFELVPADMQGQLGLIEALQSGGTDISDQLKQAELVRQTARPSLQAYELESVEGLEGYLDEASFRWLTALSYAPDLRWNMVLKLGEAIGGEKGESTLMRYDRLMEMSQLPFMESGQLPESLRQELQERTDPDTERKIREEILHILREEQVEQPSQQNLVEQSIQEAALDPEDKQLQKKMRFLQQEGWLDKIAHTGKAYQLSWYQKVPLAAGLSALLLIGFLAYSTVDLLQQLPAYSNEAILGKYLSISTEGLGENGDEIQSYAELEERIQLWDEIEESDHQQALEWLGVLRSIQQDEQQTQTLLRPIIQNPGHPYYFDGMQLDRDLNSMYRWFQ